MRETVDFYVSYHIIVIFDEDLKGTKAAGMKCVEYIKICIKTKYTLDFNVPGNLQPI